MTALLVVVTLSATNLAGKRIYVNPGHGSFGPNDRPMATIPYPNLPTTGMPDTCGFYETNTNLWKCLYLRDRLVAAGATVVMSRTENGPWPYQKVNGDYPDYWWDSNKNNPDPTAYNGLPDYEAYNKPLSVICEEVESGNYDLFISVHSNAASDGSSANYPLCLYRGHDESKGGTSNFEVTCRAIWDAVWPWRQEMFNSELEYESAYKTGANIRGDIDFYGSSSSRTSAYSGQTYTGYLGVLKHGCVGGLIEGYFHTYQPARHRALNHDYCKMEGYAYYRGIVDYFGADDDTKGYILGVIKDEYERISHNLYSYAAKTHDQWLPLNGAVVSLYKGTTKIAEYTVDSCYNGIFYFGDLEPGNDYWLDATCEGYKPMWDQYKAPITVTANTVTYPRIYLESESHETEQEQPKTYEEPEIPAYVGVAGTYAMTQTFADEGIEVLADKIIRRAIVRNDTTMYVLALDAQNNPYLYLINPSTRTLKATLPTDFCSVSASGKLKLSDIAVTADGVLIGCNEEATTFTPSNNLLIYKWTLAEGVWSGAVWLNNTSAETAGNYYNAISGSTMAYAGTLEEGSLYFTAYTTGSDAHAVRYVCYSIAAGAYAGAFRNQDATHKLSEMGHDIQFTISPRGDDKVIMTASNIAPMECEFTTTTASAPKSITRMADAYMGAKGVNFFKYAKHQLMSMPLNTLGENTGIALLDITEGVDQAKVINLTNAELDAKDVDFEATAGLVRGTDITLYLLRNDSLSRFTTASVEQPQAVGVYAYDLVSNALIATCLDCNNVEAYVFDFKTNVEVNRADVVLFNADGEEVSRYPAVMNGTIGTLELSVNDLPGQNGAVYTWGVEVEGDNVATWGQIFSDNSMLNASTARVFNAVDKSPESKYFGRIYIMRRSGSSTSSYRPQSGLYAYNQDYTLVTENLLKGGCEFGNPTRLSVAPDGYVYQADWADGYSGVYVINPDSLEGTFTQFFEGTRNGAGVFTNNGVAVGSSTPGVNVFGTGADTKLIVYNEDASGSLPANGLAIYNIGQADGSLAHSWGVAPSATITLTMQANTEGTPVGTSHGIFVSQHRTSGNNNTAAPSLLFMDYAGTMQMASCNDPYKDIIDGSDGGGYAISADEKVLVLQGGKKQFYVFDITWEGDKPVLTLRYEYEHGIQTIRQMNFDYAGNLVCSGESGLYIFAMPHDGNVVMTPARKSMRIIKGEEEVIAVTGVELDKTAEEMQVGSQLTLVATVLPEDAENKNVTWSTSDSTIATVADGVVSAIAVGTATITVTTEDGAFTATCTVEVKPIVVSVTSVALDKAELELLEGETATLVATVLPADATNKDVVWSSLSETIATVADGVVTAVAEGTTAIVVTTVDGNLTDTCVVIVSKPVVHVTGVTLDQVTLLFDLRETDKLTAQLVATVTPEDATDKSVTWASSNEAVATVAEGLVTAVAVGQANITATTVDGSFTATCAVEVTMTDGIYQIAVNGVSYSEYMVWNSQNLPLEVYSANGQRVAAGNADISLEAMPAGTYLVRMPDGKTMKVLR